ncbi:MAG: helix-turn-helix transcriptional regulator [Cellulosilyticum sp.]|nr:helix-turn-helix transcriptional regulator [Cellulosilyticum sp.]
MNEIILNNNAMPTVSAFDFCIAPEPFLHADRITDFNILIYVIKGTIYVTEDELDYEIHTGELLFLKSGIHHHGKKLISKGTQWYYAHFYLPQFSVPSLFTLDSNTTSIASPTETNYFTVLPKQLTHLNETSIEQAIFNFNQNNLSTKSTNWMIHAQFFNLLSEIAFYHPSKSSITTLADQICDYLITHYNEPFSASKLEQHFFLSYKHMAAIFKKEKQLTMQQYHTQVRMNIACKLLRTTLDSISQISEYLGYNDMLYFSRCFHQFIGMSPTAYRKLQISQY